MNLNDMNAYFIDVDMIIDNTNVNYNDNLIKVNGDIYGKIRDNGLDDNDCDSSDPNFINGEDVNNDEDKNDMDANFNFIFDDNMVDEDDE